MAFALDADAPLPSTLRDTAGAELARAIARLHQPGAKDVHEARKSLKKLRAWARLVRPALGDEHYRVINALLRDAARELSQTRDAAVAAQTLLRLRRGRHLSADHYARLKPLLAPPLKTTPSPTAARHARRLLKAATLYVDDAALPPDDGALRAAHRRARQRCARLYRQCLADPDAEHLHRWRKHIKYLGYQCALLAPRDPAVGQEIPALKALGELLGLHHDIHTLGLRLDQLAPADIDELLRLHARQLFAQQCVTLGERALAQAAPLFERPRRTARADKPRRRR